MLMRRVARPLLAATFIVDGVDTFLHPEPRVKAADALVQQGRRKLPDGVAEKLNAAPETLVRITAGAQAAGGVLLALGKAPRLAALVLAATVLPAAVTEQDFWAEPDPDRRAAKRIAFLKDIGLLGGLLIAAGDTEGKPSLRWRGRRAARRASVAVSAALPIGASAGVGDVVLGHMHDAADRAHALSTTAASKGTGLTQTVLTRGAEISEAAKEHAAALADVARERGAEWVELANRRGPEFAGLAKGRAVDWTVYAKEHGPEVAEAARRRGVELADIARHGAAGFAEAVAEVGAERADIVSDHVRRRHY
ncbi:DoxX family membrane protein [Nocardia sp. SYP-A9097]|uniref:DoxX family protein n=1 Tax=Nocardia sp. SYP-A9097 TaxID=2663237 RepID=UPI00129AC976|nr:DoxX family protein [Nocardia sp. SYP-A9097]MRH90713.1 DoxX family membrane protein [Nocardia sp. SYP-A9097]